MGQEKAEGRSQALSSPDPNRPQGFMWGLGPLQNNRLERQVSLDGAASPP